MPITQGQINLLLSQQEEILLTLSEIKTNIAKSEKAKDQVSLNPLGTPHSFKSGIRG